MRFGEALQDIFSAHMRDLASDKKESANNTRYTNAEMKAEFNKWVNNPKWRIWLHREFEVISSNLEREILSCKHEKAVQKYHWLMQCPDCLSQQIKDRVDPDPLSYDDREVWGVWRIGNIFHEEERKP